MHRYFFLFVSVYCLIILSPLIIAFDAGLSSRPLRDDIASSMAIVALSMIIFEFLLSGRFKTLSSPIGMDLIMRFHQLMGRILLLLLIIHPFLYSLPYSASLPWDTQRSETLSLNLLAGSTGFIAWFMLFVLVIFAIRRNNLAWNYEQWRASHLTLSIAIITFGLIHAFEAGRYTSLTSLNHFWLAGLVIILITLVHIYLVVPFIQRSNPYYIDKLESIADGMWKLHLKPENKKLKYQAGQFAWLKFGRAFFNFQEHPFSISSSPAQDRLEFTIKEFGDFTSQLAQLDLNQYVYIDGPHGHFTLRNCKADGVMLISGGVGIAPVFSILKDLADNNDPRPVTLLNCCRNEKQLVYRNEIEQLASRLNLDYHHILSSPSEQWQAEKGRITLELLKTLLPGNYRNWCFFICGPSAMMLCIQDMLMQLGVPRRQIVIERFSYEYKPGR